MKKDLIKISIDERYSKPPMRNYETNKILYNRIVKMWSIELADFSDYKTSNNKGFIKVFIVVDNSSKYLWGIPLKNKYGQTITKDFSKILTISNRRLLKLESDRGAEWYNSVFQNFLKVKNIHHYSRYTDKGPSIAERFIRTIRNLLKKPVFLAGNADWLSKLSSAIEQYKNTIHHLLTKDTHSR